MKKKETTSAADWLTFDLRSQSGAIWKGQSIPPGKRKVGKITIQKKNKMKRFILFAGLTCSALFSAQTTVISITNKASELIINDSVSLKKGDSLQINIPAGRDFVFVKKKSSGLNAKLIGRVADVVGVGAAAVGMGSNNVKVLAGASQTIRKANAVKYGAETVEQIQNLPISNDAKKIAGKKMRVLDWKFTDNGYVVTVVDNNTKFEIYLQEAVNAGEIILII